jgi:hypothetical protein
VECAVNINLVYETSTQGAPANFFAGLSAAVQILDSLIATPITVNIQVGYGDINGSPLPGTVSEGGPTAYSQYLYYSQLKAILANYANSPTSVAALASLPNSDPTNGDGFFLSAAQEKAFGILSAYDTAIDGNVGFGINYGDYVGVALHEITHALGRLGNYNDSGDTILNLYRFSSPSVLNFSTTASYFSIDGGVTNLANFDATGFDPFDWASAVRDPFSISGGSDTLSTADIAELNAIGFDTSPIPQRTVVATGKFSSGSVAGAILQNGGTVVDWILSNGQYQSSNVLTIAATGWTVVGTGDFNADGSADVLLQNGGTVVDWIMKSGVYQSGNVITNGAIGYKVVGTGDFNGDSTADVLLQNGGTVVDWVMKNGVYQNGNVLTNAAAGWTVVGTGDFNGDGTTDVLLQNGGTVVDWVMKNGVYQNGNVLTNAATGWTVVGTGDFNGDGVSDVLLQNGGTVVDWIMGNGVYQSGNVITNGAAGWTVVGTGDFTGDGTSDVMLENGATVVDWTMKNGLYQAGNVLTNSVHAPF